MRLGSGAAGVPVWAALEDEEADGVGVGAGRFARRLLAVSTRSALVCKPVARILPGGEGPVDSSA